MVLYSRFLLKSIGYRRQSMAKKQTGLTLGKIVGILAFLAVWFVALRYSNWYFYNGFTEKNAIMKYCSQFNNADLGWFTYVFKHGILNFVAGYGAVFPLLVPVVLLIQLFRRKRFGQMMLVLAKLFFTALFCLVFIVGLAYSALYTMNELPLLAGFLGLVGIGMLIPTGKTLLIIVVVD